MPPRGEIGLHGTAAEGAGEAGDVLVGNGLIEWFGSDRVGIKRNAGDAISAVGESHRADGRFAQRASEGICAGSGVGEDVRAENR